VVDGEPRVFLKGEAHMDPYRWTPTLDEKLSWRKETHPLLGVDVLIGKDGRFKKEDRVAFCSFRGFLWHIQLPLDPGWGYMGVTLVSRDEVLQTFKRSDLKDIEQLRDDLIGNSMKNGEPPDATKSHKLVVLKEFWGDNAAWQPYSYSNDNSDDWNSDDEEDVQRPLEITGNEVPCLPLYEVDYMRDQYRLAYTDDFWDKPGEDKKCLVPESLFEKYFRVRQLDVSERVLNLMCAELEDGSELRKGLTKMANITSISDVLENSDLHAVIQEHLRALNKN
jgi:hypothetical protein